MPSSDCSHLSLRQSQHHVWLRPHKASAGRPPGHSPATQVRGWSHDPGPPVGVAAAWLKGVPRTGSKLATCMAWAGHGTSTPQFPHLQSQSKDSPQLTVDKGSVNKNIIVLVIVLPG